MSEDASFGAPRSIVKPIYFFDETEVTERSILGGKGAGLAGMTQLGLPIPPGFTITTEICEKFYEAGRRLPDGLMDEVRKSMRRLESMTGKEFGDPSNPLLVSVRSGSAVSMPGMLDTILNLGLNGETVEGLARQSGDQRFAYDAYRRFLQMFGKTVLCIDDRRFDALANGKDLSNTAVLKELCESFISLCEST